MAMYTRASNPSQPDSGHCSVVAVTTVVEARTVSAGNLGAISGEGAKSFREEKVAVAKSRRPRRD